MRLTALILSCVFAFAGVADLMAQAAGKSYILTKDKRRVPCDAIRYNPTKRSYEVMMKGQKIDYRESDVYRAYVPRPTDLSNLVRGVKTGSGSSSISGLEKIARDYTKLGWDLEAYRWLAVAYSKTGAHAKAISTYNDVKRLVEEKKIPVEMRRAYWDALAANGQDALLRGELTNAIRSGGRAAAAEAQNRRSDSLMKSGEYEKALKTGYLRNVLFFLDVEDAVPHAMLKAAECYDKLEQSKLAEEMRNTLKKEYPQSDEAKSII
jgi:tetratricopeptide (TPR) repeat protein